MTSGDKARNPALVLEHMSKAEMAKVVGNIGMIVYDVTASKIAIKKADAAATTSWELVTSVQDA